MNYKVVLAILKAQTHKEWSRFNSDAPVKSAFVDAKSLLFLKKAHTLEV
jgi:hypothetical protein